MTDNPRVEELLEEILNSDATPEEVCRECPELLPEVRAGWQRLRTLKAEVGALFPESTSLGDAMPDGATLADMTNLPCIRGHEVQEVLGHGGVGVVYKAWHLRLNRPVALKMLLAGPYARPEELERFLREAEAVAGLRHANIVQVHEIGDVDGRPYFTMEFVEGGNLAQKLAGTPMPAREAATLVATLADAVQVAHQSGIVHRDLKPANILLTADGTPKITDFGLARRLEDGGALTLTGSPVGTPSYMAPEQAQGKKDAIGPGTDVYALGAILYECLTGRPPFKAESAAETHHQVIFQEPASPTLLNPKVPRDLETICLKCLQKNPARRYASAQDLADDLYRFLDGKPVIARPVGTIERAAKWVRRRPALATLLATLFAFLVVGAVTGIVLWEQAIIRRTEENYRRERARPVVEAGIRQAYEAARAERWDETDGIFENAALALADADSDDLQLRVEQAKKDVHFARTLEYIRQQTLISDLEKPTAAVTDYAVKAEEFGKVFAHSAFQIDGPAHETARRIREAPLAAHIVVALDEWAFAAYRSKRGPKCEHLLEIAKLADPDLRWGDRFRNPAVWDDQKSLHNLIFPERGGSPPATSHQCAIIAKLLGAYGDTSGFPLLHQALEFNPADFWINWELACAFTEQGAHAKAIKYYRVAHALRPSSAWIQHRLATSLVLNAQRDGIKHYHKILARCPDDHMARHALVLALHQTKEFAEAKKLCEKAIDADSQDAWPHFLLGAILTQDQKHEAAISHLRKAKELNARCVAAHNERGMKLEQSGKLHEALAAFREGVALERSRIVTCRALVQSLSLLGRHDEALLEHKELLGALEAKNRLLADDARAAQIVLTESLLSAGRFAEASDIARHVLELPSLSAKDRDAMQRGLKIAEGLAPWTAELPSVLAGKKQPPDLATNLLLAEWLHKHKRSTVAAVQWYESALTKSPTVLPQLRFNAACAAALAGCGIGSDALNLTDKEKMTHRHKAREWLAAEYNAHVKPKDVKARAGGIKIIQEWHRHPDLAGVRDRPALEQLSPEEQRDWSEIWSSIANLQDVKLGPLPPPKISKAALAQAHAHIDQRQWAKAAATYALLLKDTPTVDSDVLFEYAAVQLLSGDANGYRETCKTMLNAGQRFRMRPYLVARACTLAADPSVDVALASKVGGNELRNFPKEFWSLTEQGALAYRAGRFKEAVPLFEQSLRANPKPGAVVLNWLWLALAKERLGKAEEARQWLGKAQASLDQYGDGMPARAEAELGLHLHNWLEAHVLRREAEALVQPKGP